MKWVDKNTVELVNPETGGRVLIVGTAHVSSLSAEEVTRVIHYAKPDVVVIEMDPKRQRVLEDRSGISTTQALRELAQRADTVPKVLQLMFTDQLGSHILSCIYTPVGAVLDATPGAEFLAATRAAQEVGAALVLGDRPFSLTTSRLQACVQRWQLVPQDTAAAASPPPPPSSSDAAAPLTEEKLRSILISKDGLLRNCRDPEGAMDAGMRMVKALLAGRAVGATDLVEVRECARSAVEALKGGEVKVKVGEGEGVEGESSMDALALMARVEAMRSDSQTAKRMQLVMRTLVHERDLLLARSIQRNDARCIVGVVGKGHLPGICRVWAQAQTPANHLRAMEHMLPWPADVPPKGDWEKYSTYAAYILAGAGAVTAARHRPRVVTGLSVFAAGLTTGAAYQFATLMQGLEKLATVSEKVNQGSTYVGWYSNSKEP